MINSKKPQKYQFHHYSHHNYDKKTGTMHHKKDKIQTMKFDDCPLTEANPKGEKYSLRHRQQRTRNATAAAAAAAAAMAATAALKTSEPGQNTNASALAALSATGTSSTSDINLPVKSTVKTSKSKEKAKSKAPPLSKYRRKTANARERTRMREINSAFENLRSCVPVSFCDATPSTLPCNEKLTKITTLRLAMQYIDTLNQALLTDEHSEKTDFLLSSILNKSLDNSMAMLNDSIEIENNNNVTLKSTVTTSKSKRKSKKNDSSQAPKKPLNRKQATIKKVKTAKTDKRSHANKKLVSYMKADLNSTGESSTTSSPALDNSNIADLGLMLESDGDSLHLSEPCLSPLSSQHLKPFSCSLLETTKNLNNNNINNNNNILMSNNNNNILYNTSNNTGSIDIGLFLESDTDSLQFSEPCLSPLGGFDAFGPFSDLLHSGFAEQSSLDIYLT